MDKPPSPVDNGTAARTLNEARSGPTEAPGASQTPSCAVPACRLYQCPRPGVGNRGLCRACYAACLRKVRRGDSWAEAENERSRQVARAAIGLVSGLRRGRVCT